MTEQPEVVVKHPHLDSHGRAVTKAVTWRAIGTADTFVWSWLITHEPVHAGAIASMEVVTKIFLYYVHERLWRLLKLAPDSHLRSWIKAVSWRFVGSLDTTILSFLVTGNLKYAVSIAGAEAVTKIVLYYVHERVWRMIRWGRLETRPGEADTTAEPKPAIA